MGGGACRTWELQGDVLLGRHEVEEDVCKVGLIFGLHTNKGTVSKQPHVWAQERGSGGGIVVVVVVVIWCDG